MMRLTFAATYASSSPIFNHGIEKMGYVELENLGLPNDLIAALKSWDMEYQATFDSDYPPDSAFPSTEAQITFDRQGELLYERLKNALGDSAMIEYRPTGSVKVGGN